MSVLRLTSSIVIVALLLTGCGTDPLGTSGTGHAGAEAPVLPWDESIVHEISVGFDQDDYDELVTTYSETGEKVWIAATVTIDGSTYEDAGLRLKGNSSLAGMRDGGGPGGSASADSPESLPWLIDLDKFVDGENHEGFVEFVVRSNNSETALNEAVTLQLLVEAGLATESAVYASFSVNESAPTLRLVVQNLDDVWMDAVFEEGGVLYKAESTGDYSFRGHDPAAYDEVFDVEAGEDDYEPLTTFLDFLNNSDDESFASELPDRLDVESFATYLAFEDLVDNFDDIDGPGNNSYLYYDSQSQRFTVVAWDHNLAFGVSPGGAPGSGRQGGDGGVPAAPMVDDRSAAPPGAPREAGTAPGPNGPGGQSNVLVERFLAVDEFQAMYDEALERLTVSLFDSGRAQEILDEHAAVVVGSELVTADTVTAEADSIRSYFD